MSKPSKQPIFALLGDNSASVCLRARLDGSSGFRVEPVIAKPASGAGNVHLREGEASLRGDEPLANPAEIPPQDSDFLRVRFRALSAAVTRPSMEGLVVDFSAAGLLESAAPLLYSVPVHKNHWAWDVEDFIGVVSESAFDAQGAETAGVSGINVRLNVDKRLAPRIARGLMMEPSPINAVSVKVFFKFDYSHVDLVEKGMFWRMMGEQVDGSIVRLIVTEIIKFGELSFVGTGADVYNRRLPDDDDDYQMEETEDNLGVPLGKKKKAAGMSAANTNQPAQAEENTVKLPLEMIAALGLSGDAATEFTEAQLTGALPRLTERATLGDTLLTNLRESVKATALRVAALSHKGEGQPTLDTRDALLIGKADAAELATLQKHYDDQLAASLTATCQKCGSTVTSLRSSVDSNLTGDQPEGDDFNADITLL